MAQKFPLEVVVSGSDNGATSTLKRIGRTARQQMREINRGATSAGDAMRSLGRGAMAVTKLGLAGVAIGAAAAGKAMHDFVATGSELSDFNKKTGLGVEAIQQWRYALEQSGVPVESFNAGINTFSKGLGQAKLGTGKLAAGLKKMSPELLAQLKQTTDVDEALRLYVAAMEQIPDPSRRAAFAAAAFGGAGEDMALAAEAGSVELKRLREEKRKDGLMSAEAAARADDLGDKTDRLSSQWENLKTELGSLAVEAIAPHIESLIDWYHANEDLIAQDVGSAVDTLREAFDAIDWDYIGGKLSLLFTRLKEIGGGLKEVAKDAIEAFRLFPTSIDAMPWGDTGATAIDNTLSALDQLAGGEASTAFPRTGPTFNENLIRTAASGSSISEQQAQAWARSTLGFGLANIKGTGPGGVFGAGAVKDRQIGGPGFAATMASAAPKPPSGEITIKVQSAPGTTAEVVKDTTPPAVKVEGTGRRSVGGRL